jgi:hypothetical protein
VSNTRESIQEGDLAICGIGIGLAGENQSRWSIIK